MSNRIVVTTVPSMLWSIVAVCNVSHNPRLRSPYSVIAIGRWSPSKINRSFKAGPGHDEHGDDDNDDDDDYNKGIVKEGEGDGE